MKSEPLDAIPLWGIFIATAMLVALAIETGHQAGSYRRRQGTGEKEGTVGAAVAAMLGLVAFLLAFTFSLAASRFEARRTVVLEEANAIGTTYLRAAMLPDPQAGEIRTLLQEYVDVRLAAANPAKTELAITRSEQLHSELWSRAVQASQQDRSAVTALFIQSLNDMIDLHSKRLMAALRSRIPVSIWIPLYFVTFLSMAVMGYLEGLSSPRRTPTMIALVLTFSAVIVLIADLDRPGEGLLRVSQQSMLDLQKSMRALSPTTPSPQP